MAATAKQLASLKKARAARKRNLAAKKKVAVNAKSRATKKTPSNRLKARRKVNTKKGYYPNPKTRLNYFIKLKIGTKFAYYVKTDTFDTSKSRAQLLHKDAAERIATAIFNKHKGNTKLGWVKVVKK